jgi:hypothetical protein
MKSKLIRIILLLDVVIFLYGCTGNLSQELPATISPKLQDRSFLTGTPCLAPCWYNLEIGKSSKNDVIEKLQTLEFIDQKTIQISEKSIPDFDPTISVKGSEITANCIYPGTPCLKPGRRSSPCRQATTASEPTITARSSGAICKTTAPCPAAARTRCGLPHR